MAILQRHGRLTRLVLKVSRRIQVAYRVPPAVSESPLGQSSHVSLSITATAHANTLSACDRDNR